MVPLPPRSGRRPGAAARRRDREHEILDATRALFDERGVRDAQIEDIAGAVGINRAIIYRHFAGKEELFALTIVGYLAELVSELEEVGTGTSATDELLAIMDAFTGFCLRYPAFTECAMSLLRHHGTELSGQIGEAAMFRLGRAVANALARPVSVLRRGAETGELVADDPDYTANLLYVQALGVSHLARVGYGIRELPGAMPGYFPVTTARIRASVAGMVRAMLAPADASEPARATPASRD